MNKKKIGLYGVFLTLVFLFLFYIERHPIYNWDMIAYMGVVEEYSGMSIEEAHDAVYCILYKEVPHDTYTGLTAHIEDRYDCLMDASVFESELSFFRTKPLYTFLVFIFHKLGVHLVVATFLPSFISCFFLMLVAFHWLNDILKPLQAFMIGTLLLLLPKLAELCQLSSPDALSNMLLLLALYLMSVKANKRWLYLVLALCLLARIDNFIFVVISLCFLFLQKGKSYARPIIAIVIVSLISIIVIPMLLGDSANWFMKFAFLFSVNDYLQHWKNVIYDFRQSAYLIFGIISVLLLSLGIPEIKSITKIIIITFLIRCLLFPSLQERFFVAYEFGLIILLIKQVSITFKSHYSKTDLHQTNPV